MKGIVLAGGNGSRLWPLTVVVSKQLLPVYDKPMVYYPLGTLMSAGIRDVMIITRPQDQSLFRKLLGDGSQLGIDLTYVSQPEANGIAAALLLTAEWLKPGESVALILGDNIFHGGPLGDSIAVDDHFRGARIFAYEVADASRYGVVEFDAHGRAVSLAEKPSLPQSRFAVPGLYIYDDRAASIAATLTPSWRGELEITDLNMRYLEMGELEVVPLGRGVAWLDTGTFDDLQDASSYIRTLETRQGVRLASLEEVAWRQGWLSDERLLSRCSELGHTPYTEYLLRLLDQPDRSAPR